MRAIFPVLTLPYVKLQQTAYCSSFFVSLNEVRNQYAIVRVLLNAELCTSNSPAVALQPEYIFRHIPFTPNHFHPCIFSLCHYQAPLLLSFLIPAILLPNLHTLAGFGLPGHLNKRFANSAADFGMRAYYYACSSKGVGVWYWERLVGGGVWHGLGK